MWIAFGTYSFDTISPVTAAADQLIRKARLKAGLTQRQVARRLGVTQPVIARLEQPGSNPTVETLEQVLRACDHTLELRVRKTPRNIDETLVAGQLRRRPAERLEDFQQAYDAMRDLVLTARRSRGGVA